MFRNILIFLTLLGSVAYLYYNNTKFDPSKARPIVAACGSGVSSATSFGTMSWVWAWEPERSSNQNTQKTDPYECSIKIFNSQNPNSVISTANQSILATQTRGNFQIYGIQDSSFEIEFNCKYGSQRIRPYSRLFRFATELPPCEGCALCTNPLDLDSDGVEDRVDCDPKNPSIGLGETWFIDDDQDGFGAREIVSCEQPQQAVSIPGDCNDSDPDIHPGATDICGDEIDQNCNSIVEEASCSLGCSQTPPRHCGLHDEGLTYCGSCGEGFVEAAQTNCSVSGLWVRKLSCDCPVGLCGNPDSCTCFAAARCGETPISENCSNATGRSMLPGISPPLLNSIVGIGPQPALPNTCTCQ